MHAVALFQATGRDFKDAGSFDAPLGLQVQGNDASTQKPQPLLDPDSAEAGLHMGEVALRGADFLQLGGIDVLHDLGFLPEGL